MPNRPLLLAAACCFATSAMAVVAHAPPDAPAHTPQRLAGADEAGRQPARPALPATGGRDVRGDVPADWQALGPYGGDVTDVTESPVTAGLVLAGIAPAGGGGGTLYRSTDAGASWSPVPAFAFRSVFDIEYTASGAIFVASDSGVWSGSADAETWVQHDLGIGPNQQVLDVALDPSNPAVVWAGVADATGTQPVNLVRSSDAGATWSDVTPPHAAPMSGSAIAIDPSDPDVVAAVFAGWAGGGEAWVSTDGGANWTDRSAGLPGNPLRAVHVEGARLLVGGGQLFGSQYVGLFESTNLGASWTRLDSGWPLPVVSAIAVDPDDAQTILVAIDGAGVNRSTDGGASWETGVGGSASIAAQSLRFAPGSSSALWLGATSLGVYRSDDGGDTFAASTTGIAELALFAIDTHPSDPQQLAVAFQGSNNGGVLTSSDGGASWVLEPAPPTRYSSVRFAPDGTLYGLSTGPSTIAPEGLYRRNGDGSWTSLGPNQGPLFESELAAIAFSDIDPTLLVLGGKDFGVAGDETTIWRSADSGASWTKQYEGADYDKVTDIQRVPGSADQALIAVYDGFQGVTQGGALRSADGGLGWQLALDGLPEFARFPRACASAANPGTVFMSMWDTWGTGAVYRSDDDGASWTSTGWSGSPVADVACDQQDAQRLYVAQAGVDLVVQSTDQGASFAAFATGLANAGNPAELALSKAGTPLLYFAGSHGSYVTAREGSVADAIFADGFD